MSSIRLLALGFTLLVVIFLATGCDDDAPITPEPPAPTSMDTTSHDFVWEFDTIGIQFSLITSVAAVAPDDIWVTGQFFRNDSLGNPVAKPEGNVAHWDGREWTMHGFNSAGRKSWYLMDDAFCRGTDNVWVCGGGPFQWDGARWKTHLYANGETFGSGVLETWATKNAEYACVVGLRQSCAYYRKDDGQFVKVAIPYMEDCLDVTGREDGTMYVTSGDEVSGHVYKVTSDRQVEEIYHFKDIEPKVVWIQNDELHVAAKDFIYRLVEENGKYVRKAVLYAQQYVIEEAHEADNDMYFMLQRGIMLHWNGKSWKHIQIPYPGDFWVSDISVTGKHVYFVGFGPGQYCVIAHGRQI